MSRITQLAVITALALFVALPSGSARAGEPRTHDGLFLRLSAGGGTGSTEAGGIELSGGAGDLNLAIGATVARNLSIHGTLFGWLVSDPDVDAGSIAGTADGDLDMTAIGGGATYYFMPANLYLSGSLGAGTLSFDDSESDTGVVGELMLGKEWWVGGSWGLGAAAAFGFHSIPDGGVDENWSGTNWGIRFSATMN